MILQRHSDQFGFACSIKLRYSEDAQLYYMSRMAGSPLIYTRSKCDHFMCPLKPSINPRLASPHIRTKHRTDHVASLAVQENHTKVVAYEFIKELMCGEVLPMISNELIFVWLFILSEHKLAKSVNEHCRMLRERERGIIAKGASMRVIYATPCSTSYKVVLKMYMLHMCMFGRALFLAVKDQGTLL